MRKLILLTELPLMAAVALLVVGVAQAEEEIPSARQPITEYAGSQAVAHFPDQV